MVRQLKKILRIYNETFACAEGIDDLREKEAKKFEELNKMEKELNALEVTDKIKYIKKYLEGVKDRQNQFVDDINRFSLSNFVDIQAPIRPRFKTLTTSWKPRGKGYRS